MTVNPVIIRVSGVLGNTDKRELTVRLSVVIWWFSRLFMDWWHDFSTSNRM